MMIRQTLPDLDLESMLPAIDEVVMNRYNEVPPAFKRIFRMLKSTRSIEQTTEVSGLSTFSQVPDGQAGRYDTLLPGFRKTYTHLQYSNGFKVTKITSDNDKFGVFKKASMELGKGARITQELAAAYNFNRGFDPTYPGWDGQPLFSTAHPLAGGGVQSNVLAIAADPDVDSIRAIITLMRRTVNQRGLPINLSPKTLVLPPELAFVGAETLLSSSRSDTANRADNMFKQNLGFGVLQDIFVWIYLSDPHAWMVMADPSDTELRFYEREAFNVSHGVDFETRALKTMAWMQFSSGWNGFYGVAGSPSI